MKLAIKRNYTLSGGTSSAALPRTCTCRRKNQAEGTSPLQTPLCSDLHPKGRQA